ncbi:MULTISPECIES: hypothetical protein [unclassified Nocardioides]|uniref:hypothetical protein n=1 Tax=unclassified Nocardioides TaxID=2615069 RepID=UPI003622A47D
MASGFVHYTVSNADVQLLPQIGLGRRGRRMPVAAGEEYPAVVTRCPTPDFPGDATICDLMVFLNGTTPYFVRNAPAGTGQPGTYNAVAQKSAVG